MEKAARKGAGWLGLAMLLASAAAADEPGPARQLLEELQQAALDEAHSYKVADIYLRRDAIRLTLRHGTLVFYAPVAGRVTGAVFEGTGEILEVPPDGVERQQLLKFTGSPILTDSFDTAYLRFSDNTYEELRAQIRAGRGQAFHDPELVARWSERLPSLNRLQSLRLLLDFIVPPPGSYFYAGLTGQRLGGFDVLVDDRRPEPLLVGQLRAAEGRAYYDVWTSFPRRDAATAAPTVRATAYRLDSTLTPAQELAVVCEVDLELADAAQRVLLLELSRFLTVERVEEITGTPDNRAARSLEFFQNVTLSDEEAKHGGSDVVVVILPPASPPPPPPQQRTLRFRYRGRVITDVGGGVLYVGARDRWYPRIETHSLAHYQLRFRHPRLLELVAVGTLRESRADGEWKESLWVSELPLPVAGFNLGNYERRGLNRNLPSVTVYANRELEPQLVAAAREPSSGAPRPRPRRFPSRLTPPLDEKSAAVPPAPPTVEMERVGQQVAEALDYFARLFGPFPYSALKVSQIPGSTAQGYPGLLYLSTLSFLPEEDLIRMGLDERTRQHFLQIVPAHETAHQWWGNWVRLPRYRDQWLAESLAAHSSLLFLEQQPGGVDVVRRWLSRYRDDLLETDSEGTRLDDTGPLALGLRLDSSRSPNGYASLIYSKGPWVLHMLRELFRDPATSSDAVFLGVLRELAQMSAQPLTTAEFQRRLEGVLPAHADLEQTGRLDWFFEQWVYQTGIPRYKLSWQARAHPKRGASVEGSVDQAGVSELFIMPVPVYARWGEQLTRLGTVVVTGPKVEFNFSVPSPPDELLLDPYGTVLSRPN